MNEANLDHPSTTQLSALADGELDAISSEFLLRRLSQDSHLATKWQRYHLIRACLQGDRPSLETVRHDLTGRVHQVLRVEARAGSQRWLRPVAGAAIAASVAFVAVVGINANLLKRQPFEDQAAPAFTSQSTAMDRLFTQPTAPVSWSLPSEQDRARFNQLLWKHNQVAAGSVWLPRVPVVPATPDVSPTVSDQQPLND